MPLVAQAKRSALGAFQSVRFLKHYRKTIAGSAPVSQYNLVPLAYFNQHRLHPHQRFYRYKNSFLWLSAVALLRAIGPGTATAVAAIGARGASANAARPKP